MIRLLYGFGDFHFRLLSFFAILLVSIFSNTGLASVTFFYGSGCSGYSRSFEYTWQADLANAYYTGTSVAMNNNISSMRIDGGEPQWEVLLCNNTNYTSCARQLNMEGQVADDGWLYNGRCINFVGSSGWNSNSTAIPNNQISSFWIQPNSFDAYWTYYDFREDSSQTGDRYGYVELFTEEYYQGMGYKFYSSDYDFADNPIKYNGRSLRIHGNLVSRICLNPGDSCTENTLIYHDEPVFLTTVYGVQNLIVSRSSAMVMASTDTAVQSKDFAEAFLSKSNGPMYRRDSFYEWTQNGTDTARVAAWPDDECYDKCTEGIGQWACSDDTECCNVCKTNQHAYLERLNRMRWVGDSSIVFINGHGSFNSTGGGQSKEFVINALSWEDGSASPAHRSYFASNSGPDHPDLAWDWKTEPEWGGHNTDWILTTACDSLGSESVTLTQDAASISASAIAIAWESSLLSGVHGIGGFHGLSHWRPQYFWCNDKTGDELASDFWSDTETMSMNRAWGETKESFSGCYGTDRVVYMLSACPPAYSASQCIARINADYAPGCQTGPQPDLKSYSDLRWHIDIYEP